MMRKIPMTVEGAEKLREELNRLKTVERPRITNAIAEARAHGDLKENAEYHSAREQQSFIEGRILELENKLSSAQVIDIKQLQNTGKAIFGATVTLVNLDTEESLRYKIVGEDEADVASKMISVTSPLSRAMIGKMVGDIIQVQTPDSNVEYEIVEVEHV